MKTTYSRTESVWQRMNNSEKKAVMAYGEKYKAFLDKARTERQSVNFIIEAAEKKGFKPLYDLKALHEGDKVYWNQKGKSVILAVIGKEPVKEGLKIVGSHIDAPRLDLKGNPVHEQDALSTSVPITTAASRSISGPAFPWPCAASSIRKKARSSRSISAWTKMIPSFTLRTC